jgi:hypothetical protein
MRVQCVTSQFLMIDAAAAAAADDDDDDDVDTADDADATNFINMSRRSVKYFFVSFETESCFVFLGCCVWAFSKICCDILFFLCDNALSLYNIYCIYTVYCTIQYYLIPLSFNVYL